MLELLMALREHGETVQLAYGLLEKLGVVDEVKNIYQEESQQRKLWQSVINLLKQEDYKKALTLLEEMAQKFPRNQAPSLYMSALCYFQLRNYGRALKACENALNASPNKKLLQDISALKAKIESIRSNFGFGFWLQWLVATVVVGAISFIGTIGLLGEQAASSSAGFLGVLSVGISIGLAQWMLVRMRISTGIGSLLINIVITLVLLMLSLMLLTVNVWLGLLAFVGCNMISTKWSIGRLQEQAV